MGRIPPLREADMTATQKRIAEEIGGPRSGVARGPFPIWLKNPDLIERINRLALYFKDERALTARLRELAILVNARHWSSQYQWHVHVRHARAPRTRAGHRRSGDCRHRRTPPPRIRRRRGTLRPRFRPRNVSAGYAAALAALGEQGVIELVSLLGFYSLVAVAIKGFDVGLPEGTAPYFAPPHLD